MGFEIQPDGHGGVTVLRDGHPQSHVQLDDPELLAFEYVQHFAVVASLLPDEPIAVTHVGGAGLTFARYLQHVRPGTPQIVLEPDAALTEAVRRELPLPRGHRIRVRAVDGLTGLNALRDNSAQLIVLDAYDDGRVPISLAGPSAWAQLARVAAAEGLVAANVADETDRRYLVRVLATAREYLPHLALIATHDVLKKRRFGNYVLVGSRSPLDVGSLRRGAARSPIPTGVRDEAEVTALARSGKPFTEQDVEPSPTPPDLGTWRVR